VGFAERLLNELGVALLEPVEGVSTVTEPSGVRSDQCREHGMADEFARTSQVELDSVALRRTVDCVVNGKQSGQRFRGGCGDALVRSRVAVMVEDDAATF